MFHQFPVSGHRLGLLYIMISIPIFRRQTRHELQPLNPAQHWSRWISCGCQTPYWGSQEVNRPRDLVLGRTIQMWDQGTPGRAHQTDNIIVLWDPTWFPNQKQYPLRREAWEGLQPLINKFLACGLLALINSLYNTPILPVKKKDRTWANSSRSLGHK